MKGRQNDPSAAAGSKAPRASVSPFCVHLGSKKLMLAQQPPQIDVDVLDASNHCWCQTTHKIIGPDNYAAHPEDCRKGRSCFESPLEDLL